MKALTSRQAQDVRDEFNTMLSESYEIIAPRVSGYGLACELLEYPGTGLRANRNHSEGGSASVLRNAVATFRSATVPDLADVEPRLFIARRSVSEDGAVPHEPVGPMEVAGREGQADWGHSQFMDRSTAILCQATSIGDRNRIF